MYKAFFLNYILLVIVVIGALNWGLVGCLNFNLVEYMTFNNKLATKIIYMIVAFSAIILFVQRNARLPFLGNTVMPTSVFQPLQPVDATVSVKVSTPDCDGAKVVYWASSKDADNPWDAYKNFENAGVMFVTDKETELKLRCPGKYKVGMFKKELPKHVHYRIIYKNGWVSEVKTKEITQC